MPDRRKGSTRRRGEKYRVCEGLSGQPRQPRADGAKPKGAVSGGVWVREQVTVHRPVRIGDLLTSEAILESVSPRKKTSLGLGYFVSWVTNYTDQDGELVGRQRFTLFKFDSATMGA